MKLRHGSYILTVVLLTAVPVVADRIPCDFTGGSSESQHVAEINESANLSASSSYANFGAGTFKLHDLRNESNPAVQMSNSGFDGLWNFGPLLSEHHEKLFDLGYNNGNAFGKGHDKTRGNRDRKDRDDDISVLPLVATPEPDSTTLLLIGLAGLGMIVYSGKASRYVTSRLTNQAGRYC